MYGTHLEDKKICIEIGVDRKIEDFRQNIYSCFMPVLKNTMILLPTYATVLWIFKLMAWFNFQVVIQLFIGEK